jgi:HK97 gp10 family phage protein
MPIKTRLTTNGFEAYLEKIGRAGQDVDAVTDEALQAGGGILKDGMKRRVAVDTHNLQNHIACSLPRADGNVHFVEIGLLKGTDANTARYGGVQEFGSAHTHAHPYIRPALDSDMVRARAEMRRVFKERKAI